MSAIKELGFASDELAEKLDLEFDGYGTYTGHAALVKHYGSEEVANKKIMAYWQKEWGDG